MRVEQLEISNVVGQQIDMVELLQKLRRVYWNVTGGATAKLRDELQTLIEIVVYLIDNYTPQDEYADFANNLLVLCKIGEIRARVIELHKEAVETCNSAKGREYIKAFYGKRLCSELLQDL